MQRDQLQNITGQIGVYGAETPGSTASGAFYKSSGMPYGGDHSKTDGPVFTFDASRVARTGEETRPVNFTIRVWRRIA